MSEQTAPTQGETNVTPLARTLFLDMLQSRERKGIETYGTTLQTWNGRDPFQDALEEAIDGWQYLVQASIQYTDLIRDNQSLTAENERLRALLAERGAAG